MSARVLGLVLLLLATSALAERKQSYGDYEIHYNAFGSGFLTPDTAREYGILRSRARGVLVLSVQHRGKSIAATRIDARAQSADGESSEVELRAVREAGNVLYVGSFQANDGETLRFTVEVLPDRGAAPIGLSFRQQFFAD